MYAIRYNSSEYTPHLSDQQRFDHPFLCDAPEGKKEKLAWKFELLRKTKSTNGHKKKKENQMKTNCRHPLCFWLLLGEDSQDKVGFSVGLKGGGDDEVLAGGQTDAGAHLPHVNEGLGASARLVAQKETFLQVDILTASVLRAAGGEHTG